MTQRRTCANCANYKPLTWTAQAQTFSGSDAGNLTQTHPLPAARPASGKSTTRIRLEQSLAVGTACTLCAAPLILPVPLLASATVAMSAFAFVLSVALGKENQEALFKLLDRNKDGRVSRKDLQHIFDNWWDNGESEDDTTPASQAVMDKVQLGYEFHRRMPDGSIQYAVILPEHPRYIGKEKLRQAARVHEINNNECNFSKRGCGEPFGDDLRQAQKELERLGYIKRTGKAANAPRVWTLDGERWLERF